MSQKTFSFFAIILLMICFKTSGQDAMNQLLLKNYRPQSIYHVPATEIHKAKFPVIDMHSHDYAQNQSDIDQWVKNMDELGIEKVVILTMQTGSGFDSVVKKYSKYPKRFELWCGFDFTGYKTDPNWIKHAVKELERCHKMGARGIGELGDKGKGLFYSKPVPAYGLHLDDPELRPLLKRCAELNMPINIHVADPYWMYEKMDSTNDGLMNAYDWKIDLSQKGILNHAQLIKTLENAVKDNPKNTFIACHFANCSYDLNILGRLLDTYPNLWADISARYAETAPIPRFMYGFYNKYQDRLIYGTDMGMDEDMYKVTFRILETTDEHFYETELFNYHWACNGFGLPDDVLKKLYKKNALIILNRP